MPYDISYAKYVDHTVLKIATTTATLKKFCDEAKEYNFASVCVNPCNIPYVVSQLRGTGVKACAVIGFPLGANTTFIKTMETLEAVNNGAEEVDMVINVGRLKDKDYDYVLKDIKAVVDAAHPKALVKVIIETDLLTEEEKVAAVKLSCEAGACFVKTCTGFTAGKATVEDIKLMKANVTEGVQVKASAGIRTYEDAMALIEAGADRLGTSAGIAIIEGLKK